MLFCNHKFKQQESGLILCEKCGKHKHAFVQVREVEYYWDNYKYPSKIIEVQ